MATAKLMRWSGMSCIVASAATPIAMIIHPSQADAATVLSQTARLIAAHYMYTAACMLLLLGLVGLVVYQIDKIGRLGLLRHISRPTNDNGRQQRAYGLALAVLALLALTIVACADATPPGGALSTVTPTPTVTMTPTATPTPIIMAVERGTPTPASAGKGGVVWDGTITSDTSRQYFSNGKQVNTCKTGWMTDLLFLVDPTGTVSGNGEARLITPVSCSPHSLQGNTTSMQLKVEGLKDNTGFNLRLLAVSFSPQVSAEFGAYNLLFNSMTCPASLRTLRIPITSPTSAETTLNFNGTMSGCAGSGNDSVATENLIRLQFRFDCTSIPPGQDADMEKLCQ